MPKFQSAKITVDNQSSVKGSEKIVVLFILLYMGLYMAYIIKGNIIRPVSSEKDH